MNTKRKILLTDVTGYTGGELIKKLESEGHAINCFERDAAKLKTAGANTAV